MNFTLDTIAGILFIMLGMIVIYITLKDIDELISDNNVYGCFRNISGGLFAIFLGICILLKMASFFSE